MESLQFTSDSGKSTCRGKVTVVACVVNLNGSVNLKKSASRVSFDFSMLFTFSEVTENVNIASHVEQIYIRKAGFESMGT